MKKSKKSNIVIVLVVLLLALAVGYAAFSTNLTITGTAKTKTDNWKVRFTKAEIETALEGNFDETSSVTCADTAVTVNAVLQAPGDGASVTATIANEGKLDATLDKFVVEGTGFTKEGTTNVYKNGDIIVTVPDTTDKEDIPAGESRDFVFTVEWDAASKDTASDKTASFSITFTYVQGGETFTGTQSFELN